MRQRSKDWAQYWAYPAEGVELLRAHYVEHRYDPHIHETFAFGLVEGGRQTFACRGERFYSTGGSIFAINPGDAHDGAPAGEGGFVYRMIYVEPSVVCGYLGDALESGSLPMFRTPMFFDEDVGQLLTIAHDSFSQTAPLLDRQSHFGAFLVALAQRFGGAGAERSFAAPAHRSLARVRDYLHAHYPRDVSLDEIARIASLNRHHLTRSFTRAFGIAPHRYLTHVRLSEARRQLRHGRSIAETSVVVGFSDQSHLQRRFKRAFGVTPRQFQRAVTNVQ